MSSENEQVEKYLEMNGIFRKTIDDATPEQIEFIRKRISDDSVYYPRYLSLELDVLEDCIDFEVSKEHIAILLREARGFSDVLEPCFMSGLLGCLIAQEVESYKGIDLSDVAVTKARERARMNGLPEDIFVQGDIREYTRTHEAIIGRYIANDKFNHVDEEQLKAMARIAPNILGVHGVTPYPRNSRPDIEVKICAKRFEELGYKFELLSELVEPPAKERVYLFAYKSRRS